MESSFVKRDFQTVATWVRVKFETQVPCHPRQNEADFVLGTGASF